MEDTAQKYAEEARARDTKREKACGSSQSAKRPEKKKTRFGSTISKILKPGMKFEDQLVWKHNEDLGRYIWGIVVSCKRNNLFRTGGRGAIISYTLIVDFEETKETVTLKYPDGEFFVEGAEFGGWVKQEYHIGQKIRKQFVAKGGGMETWVGTITAFNGLSYVVKYEEDDDFEDIFYLDIVSLISGDDDSPPSIKSQPKDNRSPVSSEGNNENTEINIQPGEGKTAETVDEKPDDLTEAKPDDSTEAIVARDDDLGNDFGDGYGDEEESVDNGGDGSDSDYLPNGEGKEGNPGGANKAKEKRGGKKGGKKNGKKKKANKKASARDEPSSTQKTGRSKPEASSGGSKQQAEQDPYMTNGLENWNKEWGSALERANAEIFELASLKLPDTLEDEQKNAFKLVLMNEFYKQPEGRPEFIKIKSKLNEDHRQLTEKIRQYARKQCPTDEELFYNSLVSGVKLLKDYEKQPGYDIDSERAPGEKEKVRGEEKEEEAKEEEEKVEE
mmetsp:Transcript_17062/g.37670  ORF Transcript_17062/g.37670 Transcript_17062/m.37670 type:complete len:501 (+) Transcript_17062:286-1788(+)